MNSRSSVNETNLVNFSTDLSTLNQLDAKEPLLSFPFDHIYACHAESSDRRETLQLDKEVEIPTQSVITEGREVTQRLNTLENQNKKLKELLIYHLDLIQQQNDLISKREKVYQSLKQENDTLRLKLNRADRKVTVAPKQNININPPPLVHVPPPNVQPPSTVVKSEPGSSQIMFNSITELLLPDSRSNPFLFNSDIGKTKPYGQDSLTRNSETDVASYLTTDLSVRSLLDSSTSTDNFTMIDNKRSFVKKETKTETRPEPMYTVTSNSGNPVIQKIQRNRRRASGIGSLSRMAKSTVTKVEEKPETSKMIDDDKSFERTFSVNKKSKMINTYGKSKNAISKRDMMFTGSLSDRLQLIDTTPTGEDPYQIGEAEMREQSPIPKLMLQKTNHGRMKVCTDTMGASTTTTTTRIYDSPATDSTTKASNKVKLDKFNTSSTYTRAAGMNKEPPKTMIVAEPDINIVKTEPTIDWRMYSPKEGGNETSLCDFSYGENPNHLASHILPLDIVDFPDFFEPAPPLNMSGLNSIEYSPAAEKLMTDKSKKRGPRTTSLGVPNIGEESADTKRGAEGKRGRKRALSTTGLSKSMKRDTVQKVEVTPKTKIIKGKAACREKKDPLPGMVTKTPYHSLMGDPDLSWYLGLDPDVKMEDVDQSGHNNVESVEVPRWREKPYTSILNSESTENLDDKIFEKRHQKLEAEERRQLRWHMRRIREQRHVERLRQRQRDPWWSSNASTSYQQPSIFTIWPQPLRDLEAIEITDTLPVLAFGDDLPELPEANFVLPWVRTSKAQKRSKRSKTLH